MPNISLTNGSGTEFESAVQFNSTVDATTGTGTTESGYMAILGSVDNNTGFQTSLTGQNVEDLVVSQSPVVAVFRGQQVESDDIILSEGSNILLTGVSIGGTISDVQVPCQIFVASMNPNKKFILGQIEETPKILLDSSIKLGVKLYSCDNKLLNPLTFSSAYFTFDDEYMIYANLDPLSNLIYFIATPEDLSVMLRYKVYTMRLHTIDKSGNPSIVFVKQIRFV